MEFSYALIAASCGISALITFGLTWLYIKKHYTNHVSSNIAAPLQNSEIELSFLKGKTEGQQEADLQFNEKMKPYLEANFLKGFAEGAEAELAKFNITYTPFTKKFNGIIWDDFEAGYQMQLHYTGLPIGDASERVTEARKECSHEELYKLIDRVLLTIDSLAAIAVKHKIPFTLNKNAIAT